jgi:hypothetical protein
LCAARREKTEDSEKQKSKAQDKHTKGGCEISLNRKVKIGWRKGGEMGKKKNN